MVNFTICILYWILGQVIAVCGLWFTEIVAVERREKRQFKGFRSCHNSASKLAIFIYRANPLGIDEDEIHCSCIKIHSNNSQLLNIKNRKPSIEILQLLPNGEIPLLHPNFNRKFHYKYVYNWSVIHSIINTLFWVNLPNNYHKFTASFNVISIRVNLLLPPLLW